MSDDLVKIEVDGKQLEARKGEMLMKVTDAAGIYIPRFCYHKKLSVAANCRMCLVEVEKAPKPMPACATPVMDGMRVYTDSPKALAAQQGTMEFLLINHPLDCPICDQGGECELQDLAMGYGSSVSQFSERKRVVKDKNIGPLIKTDMTRCIHCTRCVRFGEEIANIRELGATGRGEHMEIGTYIEKSLVSELSGNVIDLCPVGALTSKPARYTGRSWEYIQHASVSPHDSVGSNLFLHTYQRKIMRVVPRENEDVNEVWISDRDRFSYQGIYSEDRVTRPLLQVDGMLQAVEWENALAATTRGLKAVIDKHGTDSVGFLASPNATLEEMYLFQKLARGLGIANIDHRLRQGDFSDQEMAPVYPWLGMPLANIEKLNAVLLVGSNIRLEQPLAGHRLRKAGLAGAAIMLINPRDFKFHFPVAEKIIADPKNMIKALAKIARAVATIQNEALPEELNSLVAKVKPGKTDKAIAEHLVNKPNSTLFLGNLALSHPALSQLRALSEFIAQTSGSALGYLPDAANAVGAWLAGVLPHRLAGGEASETIGLDAREMFESPRKAYVLLGVEPEFDCWNTAAAISAIDNAEFVVTLTPYASEKTKAYADIVLPVAAFGETSGSYVNAEGRCQSFQGAAKPLGEARPAWKVLRVLGSSLKPANFDYMESEQILEEVLTHCKDIEPQNLSGHFASLDNFKAEGLLRVGDVPMYATDALVRRAKALQQTVWAPPAKAYLNQSVAKKFGLLDTAEVKVRQNESEIVLPLEIDESVPNGCVWVPAGLAATQLLGPSIGPVKISSV